MPEVANGWFEKHVVESLGRLEKRFDALEVTVRILAIEQAKLAERGRWVNGIWGSIGGALAAGGGVLLFFVARWLSLG